MLDMRWELNSACEFTDARLGLFDSRLGLGAELSVSRLWVFNLCCSQLVAQHIFNVRDLI